MTAITRRHFLRVSLAATGALVIEACSRAVPGTTTTSTSAGTTTTTFPPVDPDAVFQPGVRIRIDAAGVVTVTGHRTEMGQGVLTAMAMIAAEMLDADWDRVRVEQADADAAYGNQDTGGSTSIADAYDLLATAGARARSMLVEAAARRWGVDRGACATAAGRVEHPATGRSFDYGELVVDAAAVEPGPSLPVEVKDSADFRIVGTPRALAHTRGVVDGSHVYASDVRVPGMRVAVFAYPPAFGAEVTAFDPAATLAVPGVEGVVPIPSGIAVVAADTWSALEGRRLLSVEWSQGTGVASADLRSQLLAEAGEGTVYDHPFYAHMPLEPTSCVIAVGDGSAEVWAPVQLPGDARGLVATRLGLTRDAVTLHVTMPGGRFGRGLELDWLDDAARLARVAGGVVKVVWTREDEVRRDTFHPLGVMTVSSDPADPFGTIRVRRRHPTGVPTGPWRAVEHFSEAWARESYVDELAAAAGVDPVEARLGILGPRAAAVLRTAAEAADWGAPLATGRGRGVASYATWGTTEVAAVVDVTVTDDRIAVDRVVVAVDCGLVINPDTVRAQLEGGVVWGLTATFKPGVDIVAGGVLPGNFTDLPILRFDEMPPIEVHIVPSAEPPTGIGEMAVPLVAPAAANAVFAATGVRLRSLPLRLVTP